MRQYRAFVVAQGWAPGPVTTQRAAQWFAHLGTQAQLRSGTLSAYRSALSTHHVEESMGIGPNPLAQPIISRILDGIAREWQPRESAARAAGPQPVDLTPGLLAELRPLLPTAEPSATCVWAAATLGVYAMLRPSEMLGTTRLRDRALEFEQITFYEHAGSQQVITLLPRGEDLDEYELPDRFTIALRVTKTDQLARKGGKVVAGATAVEALWRWCHLRRALGSDSPLLFACEGLGPLSMARLTGAIRSALVTLRGGNPEVKGKCFRRGGASGLVALGLDDEEVANVAGWQAPAMARTYANARAQADRRVAASRLMDPAAAAARLA